ncbi:ATP-binding protein [Gayadomonas joobiniege]|uniref:ATP-binding protein n=1 Tax=Gayadomonas joobiniege TaxID=1234606 RepID=UPI0006883760|nr:transporter substrate-binding domain-containing protein [Gayadomonas joobiniege]
MSLSRLPKLVFKFTILLLFIVSPATLAANKSMAPKSMKAVILPAAASIATNIPAEKLYALQKAYLDLISQKAGVELTLQANEQNTQQWLLDNPQIELFVSEQKISKNNAHGAYSLPFLTLLDEGADKPLRHFYLFIRTSKEPLRPLLNEAIEAISQTEKQHIQKRILGDTLHPLQPQINQLTPSQQTWLSQNHTIRYSGDPDWLPFEQINEAGEFEGIVADYLAILANLTGLKFELLASDSWLQTLAYADQQKPDMISSDADDARLKRHYRAIKPYLLNPIVILMQNDHSFVNKITELKNQRIAVIEGYGYTHALRKNYPKLNFIDTPSAQAALDKVKSGELDAAVMSLAKAGYLITSGGYYNIKVVGKTDLDMKLTWHVNKNLDELFAVLNLLLPALSQHHESDIIRKWTQVEFAQKHDYQLTIQVILICLIIVGFIISWNMRLKNEIEQKKHAQKLLKNEKDNFKNLFDGALDGHMIIHQDQILACNQASIKLLGARHSSQIVQQNIHQLFAATAGVEGFKQHFVKANRQQGYRFDWLMQTLTGQMACFSITLIPIQYDNKPCFNLTLRDQTEEFRLEQRLKKSHEQLEALIHKVPLSLLITDLSGAIIMANQTALTEYQLTSVEIKQKNILQFYHNPADRDKIIKKIKSGQSVDQEIIQIRAPSGELKSMLVSVLPINYREQNCLLSIAIDLSQRVAMEEQLKAAKEMAESANRSKSEFLANMSHEIRTPMNAIIGFTELLDANIDDAKNKTFIRTIQNAGNTLLTLINDILDLSKIESGKLEINKQACNLYQLFEEIKNIFQLKVQQKKIAFNLSVDGQIPTAILLDAVRLRQVLFNLIGNAVKFTEQGEINLSIRALNIDEHLSKVDLLISVEDTGIGIAKNQQEKIFNVFEQQEGQDIKRFGGTGLGLSITKRLVEAMGGEITLNSELGQGSCFNVLLKHQDIAAVQVEAETNPATVDPDTIRFAPCTILTVDDIANNRALIRNNFSKSDVTIVEAENGAEAVKICQQQAIDLVIMDIRMPVMDGLEAVELIKQECPDLPVIALTASAMQSDCEQTQKYQFDHFLRKPILRAELFATLCQYLTFEKTNDSIGTNQMDSEATELAFEHLSLETYQQLKNQYHKAVRSNNLNDIKQLSEILLQSTNENTSHLDHLGHQLNDKIDAFDIMGINVLLQRLAPVFNK